MITQIRQAGDRKTAIPRWRADLHDRQLPDSVIDRARIQPNGTGWLYPVTADSSVRRWKAYPGQSGQKYRWEPNKPDGVHFYDPLGDLADHIAAANGVLILATGEPDVWACWAAGVFNVTCTMAGEGTIPPWFLSELARLNVSEVPYYPDRDQPGYNAAVKLNQTFAVSGITFTAYELPYEMGSKKDLNRLLIDTGPAGFLAALATCPVINLPAPEPRAEHTATYEPPTDYSGLYEQWCIEVERAAVQAWNIAPPNGKNLSRKNFSSPLRDDRHPSAQWNYTTHGFTDYAEGEFYNTKQVAELLGVQSWEDFKAEHAPAVPLSSADYLKKSESKKLPDLPYDQPRDPDVRLHQWNFTSDLQRQLLNLYAETDSRGKPRWPDLPDLAQAVMLIGVVTEKEKLGELQLGQLLTEAELAVMLGATRYTTRAALQLVSDTGIFCRKRYKGIKENTSMYHFQQKIGGEHGKRGPTYVYMLRDQDVALDYLVATIAENALRTATYRPAGGAIIPDNFRSTPAYGLSDDELERAESARQPLYAEFAAERVRAEKLINRAARVLRQQLHDASQGYHEPAVIPDEPIPNKARYRDILDEQRRADQYPIGIRVESSAKTCAAVGFKDRQALRRSRERRGLVTDKRYKPKPLQRGDVLEQIPENVVNRGWGLRLEASNGENFEVTYKSRPYAESWAERQFASGYTVTAQIQVASLEREATAEEIKVLEAKHEKQLERQRERVKAAATNPRPVTPANDHSAAYVIAQARLSLPDYFTEIEGMLINTRSGESWELSPQVLCRAVAGSLGRKEGEEMTFTAYSAEALEERAHERETAFTNAEETRPVNPMDDRAGENARGTVRLRTHPARQPQEIPDSGGESLPGQRCVARDSEANQDGKPSVKAARPVHICHCGAPATGLSAGPVWECDDCRNRGAIIALQNIRAQIAQYAVAGGD